MTTRLHVDWTRCDARGGCQELLPELLDADPWGYPRARSGERDPAVPGRLREHVERAVADCPRLALRLVTAAREPAPARAPRPDPRRTR